jgi:carboxymethylenebutenolidase
MFQDITKPPPPLPAVELKQLEAGVSVLTPLVRRGTGPPLIVLAADNDDSTSIIEGVPSLLIKWAEEGYTVAEIQRQALEKDAAGTLKRSIEALRENSKCEPKDKIGLVGRSTLGFFIGSIVQLTVHSVRTSIVEFSCKCRQCYPRH